MRKDPSSPRTRPRPGPLLAAAALFAGCVLPAPAARPQTHHDVEMQLAEMIRAEMADKGIDALSIAVVADQELVFAAGFGAADAASVYRVGSVSKLFTDLAVMRLVEEGRVDLDADVRSYLPEFAPDNPFGAPVTPRQLMAHRSGLVREPPRGSYFDAGPPDLAGTVRSLDATRLVHPPGAQDKYSNAGIAVVGLLVERVTGLPFPRALEQLVLEPLGMHSSAFERSAALAPRVPPATMWSYDGRRFDAPTFELGMAPAGSMYSTVADLARFLAALFAGGVGPGGRLLDEASLAEMYRPQFADRRGPGGYGLGFRASTLSGHRLLGHGGAIYGFATDLAFLPEEKLGVVVAANVDVTNAVVNRIGRRALELMLALRGGRVPAPEPAPSPLPAGLARRLEGRYARGEKVIRLDERNGRLFVLDGRSQAEVKRRGTRLVVDDRLAFGAEIEPLSPLKLRAGGLLFKRVATPRPEPPPERFLGLIGEYGPDHNVLFIYEDDGRLHALIEWVEIDPLTEAGPDRFRFPATGGMYHGEEIVFERDAGGRATAAVAGGVRFARRRLQGEEAAVFTVEPVEPVAALRRKALDASPPVEPEPAGGFLPSDLVDVTTVEPGLRLDVRYASTRNFMQSRFYDDALVFLQRPAAEALARAHRRLARHGFGLLLHDGYRPWHVTKMFFDGAPEFMKPFVADPALGSRHNRGCAVDLTLFDLATGEPVEMVGLYDEGSARSYPDYVGGTALQRWRRELLRDAMEAEGFTVFDLEWWHFDFAGWRRYRIENRTFAEVGDRRGEAAGAGAAAARSR